MWGLANAHEIAIHVDWKGKWWDCLFWPEVHPRRSKGAYVCTICEEGGRKVFPNHEALWADHLFEPLKDWINDDLAPAKALSIHGSKGFRCVQLERSTRPKWRDDLLTVLPFKQPPRPSRRKKNLRT